MTNKSAIFLPLLAVFLTLVSSVNAHGYISVFTVDGKAYPGNVPGQKATNSVVRQISTTSPVKGASDPNMSCGQSAQKAALMADVNPGSAISFTWHNPVVGNWFHVIGPLMTYMASCGSTTCDQFDSSTAQWFKIDQAGQKPTGGWYQGDLTTGAPYSTKIPAGLAAGQYLIRHEIIALHNAGSIGGAEFYVSCTQVNVHGDQTGTPPASSLVSFPGGYTDSDPGIVVPNIFNTGFVYQFPGPDIAVLGGSPSSGPNSSVVAPSPTTVPTGAPSVSLPGGASSSSSLASPSAVKSPKFRSRVMGRLNLDLQ